MFDFLRTSTVGAILMAAALSMVGPQEARAQCDVDAGFGNCDANGSAIDLTFFNAAFGFLNGSGNGNALGGGAGVNLEFFNAWLGLANGSGNGNLAFGDGDALNVMAVNFGAGIANGSGNAFVLYAEDGPGIEFESINVMAGTNYFGALNGSLNGIVLAEGTSTVIQLENSADGALNFAGNSNILGFFSCDDNGEGGCDGGGDAFALIANNTAFGNANGAFNANVLGADTPGSDSSLFMVNNRLFGNANASFNGNGTEGATVEFTDNFVVGDGSASFNGNSGDGTGEAFIQDNLVLGHDSASDNGNNESGDGSVEILGNDVIGYNSLSHNSDLDNDGTVSLIGNKVFGDNSGNRNGDEFNYNMIIGNNSGNRAGTNVSNNAIIGHNSGNQLGDGAKNNVVFGNKAGNKISGKNNVAIGNHAGTGLGNKDTAVGANATVTADHSTALGADAVANLPNQVVFGTKQDTYTAPGITSGLSKARQSGPLEVVTSDAAGNLATDGGQIFRRLDENESEGRAGAALAISMENPDLTGNERFGVAANWGNLEGTSALSFSLMGVLGHNFLTPGDRVAVSGGFGTGFSEDGGDDVYGGRVGLQWTWGRSATVR